MKDIDKIVALLNKEYSIRDFPTNRIDDPYYVLISCLLSLRTKDAVTFGAAQRLFDLAKTPAEMSRLSDGQIKNAIYPVGFYNNKTKIIKNISQVLIDEYGSKVPDEIDELVKLKGVGRKTANLVVTQGYGKPGICVDTHVHRISNRIGWVKTKTPDDTEIELRILLPKRHWKDINELLVKHGQNVCMPRGPKCNRCVIEKYCGFEEKRK
ncbi:MAG: endonuclease III [Nanoarchaeota archaeon]|nr:endonuclease III [Nanoarchaeota archaeon]